jgi:pimeloyl-ACP methyl ester carboxylesterase
LDPVARARTAQQRGALKKFDFTPLLHSIQAPTLILHGEQDAVATPEAADIMARAIKRNELELVPGVGHLFLAEAPKFFYERVSKFFEAHR